MTYIGCAGWSFASRFLSNESGASVLERYAQAFDCVEVNSSFYRLHQRATYAKWAASVPEQFRFSVKLPRTITHYQKLRDCQALLAEFYATAAGLEGKLGALLVQLPPSLRFDADLANEFFESMRTLTHVNIVCEPRHASWFTQEADALLQAHEVARVAADPAKTPEAALPGGSDAVRYYRLHGSPRMYYSAYDDEFLQAVARQIQPGAQNWVIFDNTAAGEALNNARTLRALLSS